MSAKLQTPTAGDLMNSSVVSVSTETPLEELIDFFLKHEISCAPVVKGNQARSLLLGFVSEGDALLQLSNQMFNGFPESPLNVAMIMKRHPVAVTADTDVFSIASIFNSHGYRHVPVVDQENHLLGLVSRREILKALRQYKKEGAHEYQVEHFPPDLHKIMNHRFILSGGA